MAYSENTSTLKHSISDIDTGQEEKIISSEVTMVQETNLLQANNLDYVQNENAIDEIFDNTENNSVILFCWKE